MDDSPLHSLPEEWSDDRPHDLTATCWCEPDLQAVHDVDGSHAGWVVVHRRPLPDEVLHAFHARWADIVKPRGKWDHDQVMRELYDFGQLLDEVPKVYLTITGGRIAKPNTIAAAVLGEHAEQCPLRCDHDDEDA